jgi:hypothetical protein
VTESGTRGAGAAGPTRVTTLLLVLVLALGLPFGVAFSRLWSATGADIGVSRSEADGVRFLRPLVTLLSATVDLQSATVQGRTPDAVRIRSAVAEVDRVDAALGSRLGTTDRWRDVRGRVLALLDRRSTGRAAYATGSQVVDLLVALSGTVGDSSSLILDPDLDSYYLMDATLLRVPALLVAAGRLGDQSALATDPDRDPGAAAGATLAAATVRDQAAALDAGLRKSLAATDSRVLGPGLLPQLDLLKDTVSRFTPPVAEVGAGSARPDPSAVEQTRLQVRDAALGLESAGLTQLDALLGTRRDGVGSGRRLVVAVTAAGGLAALAVLWFAFGGSTRRVEDDETEDLPDAETEDLSGIAPELLEARDLLAAQQLLRVGRAVAPAREDR